MCSVCTLNEIKLSTTQQQKNRNAPHKHRSYFQVKNADSTHEKKRNCMLLRCLSQKSKFFFDMPKYWLTTQESIEQCHHFHFSSYKSKIGWFYFKILTQMVSLKTYETFKTIKTIPHYKKTHDEHITKLALRLYVNYLSIECDTTEWRFSLMCFDVEFGILECWHACMSKLEQVNS